MTLSDSQNFLKSKNLITKLLDKTTIDNSSIVVEIGAGKGIITFALCEKAKQVIAYELDSKLFSQLKTRNTHSNLCILNKDFLEVNLPESDFYTFANIPFNLSRRVLDKLLNAKNPPKQSWLIVQKEFAEKFAGIPNENLTSLRYKPYYEFTIAHRFSRTDFEPMPNVDTVLLSIKLKDRKLVSNENMELYSDFISFALTNWSPNIGKSLSKIFTFTQLKRLSIENKFSLNAKPTELSFEQYLSIFSFLTTLHTDRKNLVNGYFTRLEKKQRNLSKIHRTRKDKKWKQKKQ